MLKSDNNTLFDVDKLLEMYDKKIDQIKILHDNLSNKPKQGIKYAKE